MKKLNLRYFGIILVVVIISCFFHEFGHYITGETLGNKMTMNLNMASALNGYAEPWHALLVYAGGPFFTLIQAVVALILLTYYSQNLFLYVLVMEPVTLRIWPYLVSPFMSQDEAKIAGYLDIAPWIIPAITWIILGILAWAGSRKLKVSAKFTGLTSLLILIAFQIVLHANNLVVSMI